MPKRYSTRRKRYSGHVRIGPTRYRAVNARALPGFQTRSIVPRSLCMPLPAVMNVSLVTRQQQDYNVPAAAFLGQMIIPATFLGIDNVGPSGMTSLLRLYGRALCIRAQVHYQIAPLDLDANVTFSSCVVPVADATNMIAAANFQSFNRAAALPTSQVKSLLIGGNNVVNIYQDVDCLKFLDGSTSEPYHLKSSIGGAGNLAITIPNLENIPNAPAVLLMYTPTAAVAANFQVTRRVTYHIRFSALHPNVQDALA